MGGISVGEAISAGFRLIGREPAAFAVWSVVYLAVSFLPLLVMWPAMAELFGAMASGAAPNDAAMLDTASRLSAFQPVSLVLSLLMMAVLPPAVFRAVLTPDERRFFYLRLGMREFWVLIVTIVLIIVVVLALIASMVPAFLLVFLAGLLTGGGAEAAAGGGLLAFVGYVAVIGVIAWIGLRLSMAPILSFADNTFRFPESWRLTKGHAWRLFLVALALFAISILGQLLIVGIGLALVIGGTPDFARTMQTNPAALLAGVGLPVILVGSVVLSVFGVALYVMGAAAWAEIYRQLKPPLVETFS